MSFDVKAVREQFPILGRQVHGKPLVYFDNAASAQKPVAVIEAMADVMRGSYANVHRGLHTLANETTQAYESARESARRLLNAASSEEIVFTKGGTEAINIVSAYRLLGAMGRILDELGVAKPAEGQKMFGFANFITRVAVHAVIHEAATEQPELLAHPLLVPELVRLLSAYLQPGTPR